jgi:hypothetical protein
MLLLDSSTIARNVGCDLVFALSEPSQCLEHDWMPLLARLHRGVSVRRSRSGRVPLSGLPRVFVRALTYTSMQTPVCALHTASLRPALASCAVSDKKERESGSAPKMRHVRGSAANHSCSSPGSPWHRQLASSRRSLTFSASAAAHAVSAAAHAVSAAPALGGHPAGFLTSQSTATVPRSCPASRTTPPPGAASGLHAPAAQGPPGPGGPPSRPTLSALYGARPRLSMSKKC